MINERLIFFFKFFNKDYKKRNNKFFFLFKNRNFFITDHMSGIKLAIHNGKFFVPFIISDKMVNNMCGSFSFTRSILLKKKLKIKKKRKK